MKNLITERLILSEPKVSEAKFYFDLLNSPGWLQNIGDRNIKTLEDATGHIKESIQINQRQKIYGAYTVSLKTLGVPIGFCGLFKRDEFDFPDIGFAILPAYERQGYSYEGSKATLKYAKEIGLPTALGITGEGNLASQKLLEKLGLQFVKSLQWGDHKDLTWLYSINLNND